MSNFETNTPAATGAGYKTRFKTNNTRRHAAFGKILWDMRLAGKVPARLVQVVFSWNIARAYPRLVITDDTQASDLNFKCLSGLPVQISFHAKDAHRVDSFAQEIMKARPSWLATFAIDLVGSGVPAYTIIQPLQDASRVKEEA